MYTLQTDTVYQSSEQSESSAEARRYLRMKVITLFHDCNSGVHRKLLVKQQIFHIPCLSETAGAGSLLRPRYTLLHST